MNLKYKLWTIAGIATLSGTTLLGGCGMNTNTNQTENAAETASYPLAVGDVMTIDDLGGNAKLLDIQDSLTRRGLYYAAWGVGNAEDYANDEGTTIQLYDAQLYTIISTCTQDYEALDTCANWESTAKKSYTITDESKLDYNGITFDMLSYTYSENSKNPCDYGMSIYGADGTTAICVEISCRNQWDGDGKDLIKDFLDHCHLQ